MKKEITNLFNRFAGKEIPMKEVRKTIYLGGEKRKVKQIKLEDSKHPTIQDMHRLAVKNGLVLRLWWPGVAGTRDMRMDRINAHIEKDLDGKWRVSKRFHLG